MYGCMVDVTQPQAVGVCDRECVGRLYLHQKGLERGAFTGAFGSEAFVFIILISQGFAFLGKGCVAAVKVALTGCRLIRDHTLDPALQDVHIGEAFALTPCDVFGDRTRFFLCERGHDRDKQLALAVEGVDALFLKVNLSAVLLELADSGVGPRVNKNRNQRGNREVLPLTAVILTHLICKICQHLPELQITIVYAGNQANH